MSERGQVHTFHPTSTKKDKLTGERVSQTWETSWCYRFEYHGKKHQKCSKNWTRQQARDAGMERYREVRAGLEEDPRKTTFETLSQIITAEYRLKSPHTQAVLKSRMVPLRAFFHGDLAQDITRPRLIDYVQARLETAAPGTVRLELAYLRRAMRLAFRQGRMTRLPDFPTVKAAVRRVFLREDEVEAILAELPAEARGVVRVAHETGWRLQSEILTRQWAHVDFQQGWLFLEKGETKNGDPRAFPLTSRLRAALEEQRAFVDGIEARNGRIVPWVFPRLDGQQLPGWIFSRAWRDACAKAGLVDRRPHDLRRTATVNLDEMGLSESQSMALIGHRSPAVHRNYRQTDARSLRQALELIEKARAAQGPAKVERIRRK